MGLFQSARQERVYQRLLLIGPGPAAFYRDACWIMSLQPPPASTTHVVSHLLREIESALRAALDPLTTRLAPSLEAADMKMQRHKADILAVLRALEIPESDPIAQGWLRLTGDQDSSLAKMAHREALDLPRALTPAFLAFWEEITEVLDVVLDRLEARYTVALDTLDALLAKPAPSSADLARLRQNIPNNIVVRGHFFSRLNSTGWLRPLWEAGFFDRPPDVVSDPETGEPRLLAWPESSYLARISAKEDPTLVRDVALSIPETRNLHVHDDLLDVTLQLPPSFAVAFVPRAKAWILSWPRSLIGHKLGALIAHLARGGYGREALDLAAATLALKDVGENDIAWRDELSPLGAWTYSRVLHEHVPTLVDAVGLEALDLLCGLLDTAIRLAHVRGASGPQDYSTTWRPTIEPDDEEDARDTRAALVSAVVLGAANLVQSNRVGLRAVVQTLARHPWRIYERLVLHVVRVVPDASGDVVAECVIKRRWFDDRTVWREYGILLRDQFARLRTEAQRTLLDWIQEGPDLEAFRQRHEHATGEAPSADLIDRYAKAWRLDKLGPISAHLDGDSLQMYLGLVAEIGEPEPPDREVERAVRWSSPKSPRSAEELAAMTPSDLNEFLKTWTPPRGPFQPSYEGVARLLTDLVTAEPGRLAPELQRFRGINPTYARAFVTGFLQAVRADRAFPWTPVLAFCHWIVTQPRMAGEDERSSRDRDPEWGLARHEIAAFLAETFESDSVTIPLELRAATWDVLKVLATDPNPTPEYEARYGGSNQDPLTMSFNAVRPRALTAIVKYGLWVRRELHRTSGETAARHPGFQDMPEVAEVLDAHLDVSVDPSLAVRAVYGRHVPWLNLLDHGWMARRLHQIFPHEESSGAYWQATWMSYVRSCRPYNEILELLRGEYAFAIEHLDAAASDQNTQESARKLAEHIADFYRGGLLDLGQDGLVGKLFRTADDRLRTHAIWTIGTWLREDPDLPEDVATRLRALWEWRLEAAVTLGPRGAMAEELGAFGRWFASGRFPDAWALDRFTEGLERGGTAPTDHFVVERLETLVPSSPAQSVRCVSLMIDRPKDAWALSVWEPHVRNVLAAALVSANSAAAEAARDVVNRLVARGYTGLRDLLSSPGSPDTGRG